ncbi:MAG: ABC transporter ATP-binding protein [Ignavibacteriales bacterium]|jgi:ATP-binding cassette subfamily F protein 3|nr:MAG: ABC transporter ATP-binding protein [Ignavibacteriales bacterium]
MIDLIDISVQFTGEYLFEKLNLRINSGDKFALVGSNGTGKSTLLKIINKTEQPESGLIQTQKGLKIGYLPQDFLHFKGSKLFDEVKKTFRNANELDDAEARINAQLKSITDEIEKENLIHQLGDIHHQKEESGYYEIDSKIGKVLSGLGFSERDFYRYTDEFSGGWQMRIELAKILLADNHILLLDEPTNHLDIDSLQWVIDFLKNFKGTLILISHDQHFVNSVTTKTIEIFNKKVNTFNGNYEKYLKFKKERDEQLVNQLKNREREVKQLNRFIERFRYKASKARQVQSRVKMLERLEEIDAPESENKIEIHFPEAERSGAVPVDIKNVSKTYNVQPVFENVDLQIHRGDKIAFVGPNGAGKTTLAKIISGNLSQTKGEVLIGHNTSVSYYAQEVTEQLNPENDLIDTLSEVSDDLTPGRIRTILGSFLFSDDDVFKKVKVLSGGEKSRLALAKILIQKANLIILDEPTNHLDYESKRVLQNALIKFNGTLIIVSHDVDFLRPIVNKVIEIKNSRIKHYPGSIDYYLQKKNDEITQSDNSSKQKNIKKEEKRRIAEIRQEKYKATLSLKNKLDTVEKEIEKLETEKLELENSLADPTIYNEAEKIKKHKQRYIEVQKSIEDTYNQWTEISSELESIERKFDSQLSINS